MKVSAGLGAAKGELAGFIRHKFDFRDPVPVGLPSSSFQVYLRKDAPFLMINSTGYPSSRKPWVASREVGFKTILSPLFTMILDGE